MRKCGKKAFPIHYCDILLYSTSPKTSHQLQSTLAVSENFFFPDLLQYLGSLWANAATDTDGSHTCWEGGRKHGNRQVKGNVGKVLHNMSPATVERERSTRTFTTAATQYHTSYERVITCHPSEVRGIHHGQRLV